MAVRLDGLTVREGGETMHAAVLPNKLVRRGAFAAGPSRWLMGTWRLS